MVESKLRHALAIDELVQKMISERDQNGPQDDEFERAFTGVEYADVLMEELREKVLVRRKSTKKA